MKELSIYIHIPFCVQKCLYCDFLSGPSYYKKADSYIAMLVKEMEQYKERIKGYQVKSIFLGGGTPSILTPEQIEKVMSATYGMMDGHILPEAEITIEANPGTLTKDKLEMYRKLGINRLSIGLQSTWDDELKMLGRIHNYEEFLEGYHLARSLDFQNINIDLMSGLPKQTLEKWEMTLERIIQLKPEHISAYSLIIEEGTHFYEVYGTEKGEKLLPDEELDRLMYERTKELLKNAGYNRYEISNYAKPGMESRHNSSYWTGIDYLGIGLGSSSLLNKKRYRNEENMECYLERVEKDETVQYLEEVLTPQSEMEEFMILGLRMMKGVSRKSFDQKFGKPLEEVYGEEIQKLIQLNLVDEREGYLFLTDGGIDVSNEVFTMFLMS